MRKALIAIASVAALVGLLLIGHHQTKAADHFDKVAAAGNEADILDLYTFMQGGGNKLNLIATFSSDSFADSLQYVFHVNSSAGYGQPQTETLVICQFAGRTNITCFVGNPGDSDGGEFAAAVTGDPSNADAPLQDAENDPGLRVFAGTRNDPFFFNLSGFQRVAATVQAVAAGGGLTLDVNSCPNNIDDPAAGGPGATAALVNQLAQVDVAGGTLGQQAAAVDSLAGAPVDALVIQVDKSLVNSGGNVLGIWASTRMR